MAEQTAFRPVLILMATVLLAHALGCYGSGARDQAKPAEVPRAASGGAPKGLIMGLAQEPPGFVTQLTQGTGGVGGNDKVLPLAHNYLMVEDSRTLSFVPQLAAEPLSVERGTWRVNPDGTMETTWKLKPNVKWHDSTPFTSEDLLFSLGVYKDPELPNTQGSVAARMVSGSAPDPHTLVIQWSSVFVQADRAPGLTPLPRHLLLESYETQKSSFIYSPRFTAEFVGLGPYQLARWEGGLLMEFRRFDEYYRGRPTLDGITVRFLGDPNTLVANLLAGAVDLLFSIQNLELALDVKRRWEGTRNEVLFAPSNGLFFMEIQHRPDYAGLAQGLVRRPVRQALYHALDRSAVADVVTGGLAPIGDSWIAPTSELRPLVEDAIPQFPFDLGRAQQLLAQSGWGRGADGVLVHQASGERFELLVYGSGAELKDLNVIVSGWKAVGVEPKLYTIPPALERDREHRSTLPGAGIVQAPADMFYTDRLHSKVMTSAANGWSGPNRGGYANPRVDALLDRLVMTIDPVQRLPLHRELLQEQMGDVALMPMYWRVGNALFREGVRGIISGDTWNVYEWDVDRS